MPHKAGENQLDASARTLPKRPRKTRIATSDSAVIRQTMPISKGHHAGSRRSPSARLRGLCRAVEADARRIAGMTFSSGLSGVKSDSPASRHAERQYATFLAGGDTQFVAARRARLTDTVNHAIAAVDRLDRHGCAVGKTQPQLLRRQCRPCVDK